MKAEKPESEKEFVVFSIKEISDSETTFAFTNPYNGRKEVITSKTGDVLRIGIENYKDEIIELIKSKKGFTVFDVLGLGESLKEYIPNSSHVSVGVNDIFKHHAVDYLICVDRVRAFTSERFETIANSTPKKFYTHIDEWNGHIKNVQHINLAGPRGSIKGIESENICYSNNSTYVAVVIAYKHGAKEINIFGADFNTHPNFKDSKGDITIKDFKLLFDYLKGKGVKINISKGSKLNEI